MNKFKFFLSLVAICAGLASCTECNKTEEVDDIQLNTDTIPQDSLAELLLFDKPQVPESVDANFDDFLYTFITDQEFFDKRVTFPLDMDDNGIATKISKAQWKEAEKIKNMELMAFIYTNDADLRYLKSDTLKEVLLEYVDLKNFSTDKYLFRTDGDWKLVKRIKTDKVDDKYQEFTQFYSQFISDSVFQCGSVSQTLTLVSINEGEMDEGGVSKIKREEWPEFHSQMPMPEDEIVILEYGQDIASKNDFNLLVRSVSQPLFVTYKFKRAGRKWMLHTIEF